jgi:hypothetical protein
MTMKGRPYRDLKTCGRLWTACGLGEGRGGVVLGVATA